jgi:hypothetical protein
MLLPVSIITGSYISKKSTQITIDSLCEKNLLPKEESEEQTLTQGCNSRGTRATTLVNDEHNIKMIVVLLGWEFRN